MSKVVQLPRQYHFSKEEQEIIANANKWVNNMNPFMSILFTKRSGTIPIMDLQRKKYLEELQEFEDLIGRKHKIL